MTDEEMFAWAKGLCGAIVTASIDPSTLEILLDPERYFEGSQDAVCLAQQLIAEATGLVGVGDD